MSGGARSCLLPSRLQMDPRKSSTGLQRRFAERMMQFGTDTVRHTHVSTVRWQRACRTDRGLARHGFASCVRFFDGILQ